MDFGLCHLESMPKTPTFHYAIGGQHKPILPNSSLWKSPLPSSRHHFSHGSESNSQISLLTHGEYFEAARSFLAGNQFKFLSSALSRRLSKPVSPADIQSVDITLMKHGEFYHPAQITVTISGKKVVLVLNLACSSLGRQTMETEIASLMQLSQGDGTPLVPRVFGKGEVSVLKGQSASIFLGDWFEDYHEFHLSIDPKGALSLCVWDEERSHYLLDAIQSYALYHEASKLLTSYYNIGTYEQIFPWHHAAGDFIVKVTEKSLNVRLITVRRYAPMFRVDQLVPIHSIDDQRMSGLLFFLLNLSIRMRLDRLDGIGDIAWADDSSMVGVWNGFRAGLQSNRYLTPDISDPLVEFESYISRYSEQSLYELSSSLISTYHPEAPEIPVILKHLPTHITTLCDTISAIGFSQ